MTPDEAIRVFAENLAGDDSLRERLAAIRDHTVFAEACVTAAATQGLAFTAADMRTLLQARHIQWIQRHIE